MKPETIRVYVRAWATSTHARCDTHGIVRVYDAVTGHYTVCHPLTCEQIEYVRTRVRWTR